MTGAETIARDSSISTPWPGWRRIAAALGVLAWAVIGFVIVIPDAVEAVGSNLDESWKVGLILAARAHRQWGSDVIFTFGPLGFLDSNRYLFFGQWLASVTTSLVVHAVFIGALVLFLRDRGARLGWWVLVGGLLFLPLPSLPSVEHESVIATLVLLFVAATTERPRLRVAAAAGAGVLIAFLTMVKGTSVLSGTALLAVFALFGMWRPMRLAVLVALASAVLAFISLWVLAGQGLFGIPAYVVSELQIITGYSPAMGVEGNLLFPAPWLRTQLAGCAIVAGVLATQMAYLARRRDWAGLRVLVLLLPVLFVEFKEGFVRFGANQLSFYAMLALMEALAVVAVVAGRRNGFYPGGTGKAHTLVVAVPALIIAATALFIITGPGRALHVSTVDPEWPHRSLVARLTSYGSAADLIRDPGARARLYNQVRAGQRQEYGMPPPLVDQLGTASTDVTPIQVGMISAYDLNYRPRPVMQSYVAYTPTLDYADAAAWAAPDAPQRLVATYFGVDMRYAAFDEPATFRTMLERYRVVDGKSPWLLLERRPSRSYHEVVLGRQQGALGVSNTLPSDGGGALYANLQIGYSPLGRVISLLYKPPVAWITLEHGRGMSQTYRFVIATAADGLYMSSYLADTADLQALLKGQPLQPVTAFTVSTDHPVAEYQPNYTIEYRVRRPES